MPKKVIVLSIVAGIVAGFIFSTFGRKYFSPLVDTNVMENKVMLKYLKNELSLYKKKCGHYPSSELGLSVLAGSSSEKCNSYESKFDEVPLDPWGNHYVYHKSNLSLLLLSTLDGNAGVSVTD